jgi:hypothetical protein
MPIDLGDNPIGATPTIAQAAQMCTALKVGTGNDVTFNKVGIGLGATGPVTPLDINGNQMCIRQPFTPSIGASGPAGTICWGEAGNLYIQTGASGWKYVALGPVEPADGSTGLTSGSTLVQLEYIPFLATSEKLIIRVEVTDFSAGATGATGVSGRVGLGTVYSPFEYAIIENTADAFLDPPTSDYIEFPDLTIGEYVIISLKVKDSELGSFTSTDKLTPGYTLSAATAFADNLDCSITFAVALRT